LNKKLTLYWNTIYINLLSPEKEDIFDRAEPF